MAGYDPSRFGPELRQCRTRARLSLAGLAQRVHYSKSHLSKVETGVKPPSKELARRCDAALECHGALSRLVPGRAAARSEPVGTGPTATDRDSVWLLSLDPTGADRFTGLGLVAGLPGVLDGLADPGLTGGDRSAPLVPAAVGLGAFRSMFDQLRLLGQQVDAAALMPILVTHIHGLRKAATGARPADRAALLRLAGRCAEFTGWMAQEIGDDEWALRWTDLAVALASAGGEADLAAYACVRRSLVALYRHDAAGTIALARQAQSTTTHPRIGGLAAHHEAQGHALAGDPAACRRALDRAATLLARVEPDDAPVIGTSHVDDPVMLARGWCLYELGRHERAVELLHAGLAGIPAAALRARSRFAARLALAYAAAGEPERACTVVEPVLDAYEVIGSATIRVDLRSLARTLNRWHTRAGIQDTRLRLTAALSGGPR